MIVIPCTHYTRSLYTACQLCISVILLFRHVSNIDVGQIALTCVFLLFSKAVKELQSSAREAIILLKAMIGEVRSNVEEEESAICCLFKSMQVSGQQGAPEPCESLLLRLYTRNRKSVMQYNDLYSPGNI